MLPPFALLLWMLALIASGPEHRFSPLPAYGGPAGQLSGDEEQARQPVRDEDKFKIARIEYRGGGDWYSDPSALTNLVDFSVNHIPISIHREYDDVSIGSRELSNYPFVFMTGHGNIDVNATEASNMRAYLDNGGFLYIDDDYGFDSYVRPVIEQIFPDEELIELPASHSIYSAVFDFPDGLPKIHEHDGNPPQGFGIFRNGRLVLYYTYETNLSDGWAFDVHDNPDHLVEQSLQMGTNLLVYAFTQEH
ncbi:MAG: DUF4159 domain-containing protein [Balneolales bacterium]